MKKAFFLVLVSLSIFFLQACSDSDKDEPEPNDTPSITGVWENGNYFVSFNNDGFYAAYVADKFIDNGNYTQSKDVVSCQNTYFNRNTTYTIKSISDTELKVDIAYTDLDGNNQNKNMTFTKSTTLPATQRNILEGKLYTWYSSLFETVRITFSTYNSGIKSATKKNVANYPLRFFYVYIGERLYYQILSDDSIQIPTIHSWTSYETVECWKLSFSPNGSINNHEVIE